MTDVLDHSPYLDRPVRTEEQALRDLDRTPCLGHNTTVDTDIGSHGLDDMQATLPLVKLAIPLVSQVKDELDALNKLGSGSAGTAAFMDACGWAGEMLEDLQNTQRAFNDALREAE